MKVHSCDRHDASAAGTDSRSRSGQIWVELPPAEKRAGRHTVSSPLLPALMVEVAAYAAFASLIAKRKLLPPAPPTLI